MSLSKKLLASAATISATTSGLTDAERITTAEWMSVIEIPNTVDDTEAMLTMTFNERRTIVRAAERRHAKQNEFAIIACDGAQVERRCARSGVKFLEAYGVPFSCSPRSEAYWTM